MVRTELVDYIFKSYQHSSFLLILLLAGCIFDSGEDWRDGPYTVIWIDIFANRTLNYDVGNGLSIVRVDKAVVAVRSDDKYVVVQQQVDSNAEPFNFFIIERQKDHKYADSKEFVIGPLSVAEFKSKKVELKLPEFNKRF